MDYIVYDVETQKLAKEVDGGWDNIYGMGLASCVAYDSASDTFRFFGGGEEEINRLCRFLHGKLAVSFNGISFDSRLLLGNERVLEKNGVTRNEIYWWANADIYAEVHRNILNISKTNYPFLMEQINKIKFPPNVFSLDSIVKATLRSKKFGNGKHAPELFKNGQITELFQYNLQDTKVTNDLYLFIKKFKYVVTGSFDIVYFE